MDNPQNVHTNHEFPVAGRHVDHPGAVHGYAGIVAGDVKLAEIALGLRQGIKDGLLLRYVDPHRHDALVGPGKAVRRLLDRVFLDVCHDNVRAGLRERGRNAQADAGRGAGDDGGLAGDVYHPRGPFPGVRTSTTGRGPLADRRAKDAHVVAAGNLPRFLGGEAAAQLAATGCTHRV